jgi:hypothetical protein
MNVTWLLEVANKVFVNGDHEAKQEANKRMKTKLSLLDAALGEAGPDQAVNTAIEGETQWKIPTLTRPTCLLQGN